MHLDDKKSKAALTQAQLKAKASPKPVDAADDEIELENTFEEVHSDVVESYCREFLPDI